ncbi:hypothetical protein JHK82_012239 [Glycine max]|nr:hypothetical protein JHK82_012239 [Glycine max]
MNEQVGSDFGGRVAIATSSMSVVAPLSQLNPLRLGFFLISEKSLPQVIIEMEQNPTFYILNSPYTFHLFTFLNLPPPPATFNCSYPITVSDEYNLFFANCIPESFVSMEIHTEFFNLNRDTSYNYLSSITPTFLPSCSFSPSLTSHSSSLYIIEYSFHRIHLLMASFFAPLWPSTTSSSLELFTVGTSFSSSSISSVSFCSSPSPFW